MGTSSDLLLTQIIAFSVNPKKTVHLKTKNNEKNNLINFFQLSHFFPTQNITVV